MEPIIPAVAIINALRPFISFIPQIFLRSRKIGGRGRGSNPPEMVYHLGQVLKTCRATGPYPLPGKDFELWVMSCEKLAIQVLKTICITYTYSTTSTQSFPLSTTSPITKAFTTSSLNPFKRPSTF